MKHIDAVSKPISTVGDLNLYWSLPQQNSF